MLKIDICCGECSEEKPEGHTRGKDYEVGGYGRRNQFDATDKKEYQAADSNVALEDGLVARHAL